VPATPPSPIGGGDVNDDHEVNSIDALLILQMEAGLIPRPMPPTSSNADVNRDDAVNALDALLILQYVADLIPHLPWPYKY
jgi:hypothetical protein